MTSEEPTEHRCLPAMAGESGKADNEKGSNRELKPMKPTQPWELE